MHFCNGGKRSPPIYLTLQSMSKWIKIDRPHCKYRAQKVDDQPRLQKKKKFCQKFCAQSERYKSADKLGLSRFRSSKSNQPNYFISIPGLWSLEFGCWQASGFWQLTLVASHKDLTRDSRFFRILKLKFWILWS